jgi:hypothetical protein
VISRLVIGFCVPFMLQQLTKDTRSFQGTDKLSIVVTCAMSIEKNW